QPGGHRACPVLPAPRSGDRGPPRGRRGVHVVLLIALQPGRPGVNSLLNPGLRHGRAHDRHPSCKPPVTAPGRNLGSGPGGRGRAGWGRSPHGAGAYADPRRATMRVLLIEDHVKLAETVAAGLRLEGIAVDIALDGEQALDRVGVTSYDVVVLDRDLPGVSGDEVCRHLVAAGGESRIVMLTAAGTIEDRVDGLSLGPDHYLPKPFAFAELVAP